MAKPLTKQEKEEKKLRDNLRLMHNRVLGAFSFKQIKTWNDLYKHLGLENPTNSGEITFQELKSFLKSREDSLEKRIIKNRQQHETSTPQNTIPINVPQNLETRTEEQKETIPVILPTLPPKKTEINADNDYGLHPSPKESVKHFWFQKKAIKEAWDGIVIHKKRAMLVLAGTGLGKTFISGGFLRRLEDISFVENEDGSMKTYSHIPYLYITRATIVEQTKRVFQNLYKLTAAEVEVINIEQLRSKAGRLWVTEKMEIVNGCEEWRWEWKKTINPCVIMWDECQALKNDTSAQHKIASAYNDLKTPYTYQLFISATPFTRVSEAKCFAVACHHNIEHLGYPPGTILNNSNWPSYAAAIASPANPFDYNESAVERLMDDLKDYVIRVKGVRPQFEASNEVQMIKFETKEEHDYYKSAYERYLKEKEKLEAQASAQGSGGGGVGILVEFLKFRMAAEYCRRYWFAKEMYRLVTVEKKAVAVAVNFKATIIAVVQILVNDYGVSRDQISLVWGGGQTGLTKKQKAKQKIKELADKFEAMGMSSEEMLEEMDLENVEDRIIEELDPSLRLGTQSREERQIEIDKYQAGKTLYCLYTFRAGGVGLSLHHTDEFTKEKVRRKESGYAVEEDIPKIPTRQREGLLGPTYSAIEMVQGLGRLPRLTSLSPTRQRLVFYEGTIEEDVALIVSKKLKCLSKVSKNREKWEDVIIESKHRSAKVKEHLEAVPEEELGENSEIMIGEIESSEDEE